MLCERILKIIRRGPRTAAMNERLQRPAAAATDTCESLQVTVTQPRSVKSRRERRRPLGAASVIIDSDSSFELETICGVVANAM